MVLFVKMGVTVVEEVFEAEILEATVVRVEAATVELRYTCALELAAAAASTKGAQRAARPRRMIEACILVDVRVSESESESESSRICVRYCRQRLRE